MRRTTSSPPSALLLLLSVASTHQLLNVSTQRQSLSRRRLATTRAYFFPQTGASGWKCVNGVATDTQNHWCPKQQWVSACALPCIGGWNGARFLNIEGNVNGGENNCEASRGCKYICPYGYSNYQPCGGVGCNGQCVAPYCSSYCCAFSDATNGCGGGECNCNPGYYRYPNTQWPNGIKQ